MRRIDKRQRRPLRMYFVLCAAGTIAMLLATWVTFVSRPADYETLRTRGVLLAIDATEDVLHDLPRPDSVELAGAISHLRERLAAVPRIDPSLLDVPERLSRRAREAKRLDPEPLHEELAQLRWRVAARAAQL